MFCTKCGSDNDDNAYKCVKCGRELREPDPASAPQVIPNYLVQSILVTLFCCLPLGIPAIICAAQVNGKIQSGDIEGAMESSRRARMWGWWSFGVGLVVQLLYLSISLLPVILAGVASARK